MIRDKMELSLLQEEIMNMKEEFEALADDLHRQPAKLVDSNEIEVRIRAILQAEESTAEDYEADLRRRGFRPAEEVLAELEKQAKANEETIRADERRKIADKEMRLRKALEAYMKADPSDRLTTPMSEESAEYKHAKDVLNTIDDAHSPESAAEDPRGDELREAKHKLKIQIGAECARWAARQAMGVNQKTLVETLYPIIDGFEPTLASPARTEGLREALERLFKSAKVTHERIARKRKRTGVWGIEEEWEIKAEQEYWDATNQARAVLAAHPPQGDRT
jgi:hypothetical protein